jgi:RNA polymerase sigma factor (sigma-70 family)
LAKPSIKYSEFELVSLLQNNDSKAFSYLYTNYSAALYGVIMKVVRDEVKAQDVLQDSFMKIWKNIASYNPEKGRLFTWMMNITRNTAIDSIRSEKEPHVDIQEQLYVVEQQSPSFQPSINAIDLSTLVEKLRPERKQVLDLVYFQGYTQEEAAEQLSMPLGTVKTRIRSALQELKTFFAV